MSSSESMLVDAVVTGVGGEPCDGRAAAAEVLLLGWRSLFVEDNFASAAFLLRDLGGMVTGDSEAETRVLLLRRWGYCGAWWEDRMGRKWVGLGCEEGRWGSEAD